MNKPGLLKQWREQCRISQSEAAKLLGVSPQRYSYMEHHGKVIPHSALRLMANAWAESTEQSVVKFYGWYHNSGR